MIELRKFPAIVGRTLGEELVDDWQVLFWGSGQVNPIGARPIDLWSRDDDSADNHRSCLRMLFFNPPIKGRLSVRVKANGQPVPSVRHPAVETILVDDRTSDNDTPVV